MLEDKDQFQAAEEELAIDEEVGLPLPESIANFINNRFKKRLEDKVLKKKLSEYIYICIFPCAPEAQSLPLTP